MDLLSRRRKKPARRSEQKPEVYRPQECDIALLEQYKITTFYRERVMQCDQTAIRLLPERCKRALDLYIFFDGSWLYIDFETFGSSPHRVQKQICVSIPHRVEEKSYVLNGRHKLSHNLNPFGGHRKLEKGKPRSVSSRTRQTCDESLSDRIAYIHEYGWDTFRFSLHRREGRGAFRHEHIGRRSNQFRRIFTQKSLDQRAAPKLPPALSSVLD